MNPNARRIAYHAARMLAAASFAATLRVAAQVAPPPPAPPPAAVAPQFTERQLDQLLAPIALYPDEVLAPLLMAATYPLEVVEADRWLQDSGNGSLHGQQLVQALQSQSWDASVKSLVAFPQILAMMDSQLDWTEQLGDAFGGQQADVMNSIQRLRARAQAARTLVSSPQQIVSEEGSSLEIEPSVPDTVYVPVYDTYSVYGDWPYPDYPPYDFAFPGYGYGSMVGFAIVAPLWGWSVWNWPNHGLTTVGGFGHWPGPGPGSRPLGPWRHQPVRRQGEPIRNEAGAHVVIQGGTAPPGPSVELRGYSVPAVVPRSQATPLRAAPSYPAQRPASGPGPAGHAPSAGAPEPRGGGHSGAGSGAGGGERERR